MTVNSIGDMARSGMMRRQNVELKQQMSRLTQELSSGKTDDIAKHLRGDYKMLGGIENRLGILEAYQAAASEARIFTTVMQSTLGRVQETSSNMATDLLNVTSAENTTVIAATSHHAIGQMNDIVSALNTKVAGRSIFAGVATDAPALASASEMLNDLRTVVAGSLTYGDVITAVDGWFDTLGGGFETTGYTGATQGLSPYRLGDGEAIDLDLRADNTALREILKNASLAALASDASLGLAGPVQKQIMRHAGEGMISAQEQLTGVRADLGYAENRIEESAARIATESTASEYARGALIGVDPYETATELQNVQAQLETLYAVTVRMSRLSLMEFMQ